MINILNWQTQVTSFFLSFITKNAKNCHYKSLLYNNSSIKNMKNKIVSGPARAAGDLQPDILSPMDLDEMLSQLQDCNAIRYAAYRTASKLDLLRSALRLDLVKLGAVSNVFHQRGYSKTSKANRSSPNSEINQVKQTDGPFYLMICGKSNDSNENESSF